MTKSNQGWWLLGLAAFVACVYFVSPVLMPFAVGTFIAYLGNPLVNGLAKIKVSRSLGALMVFLVFGAIFSGLLILLMPALEREMIKLIEVVQTNIPDFVAWLQAKLVWFNVQFKMSIDFSPDSTKAFLVKHVGSMKDVGAWVLQLLSKSSTKLTSGVINIIVILIVSFYFMRDWPQLLLKINNLVPRSKEKIVSRLASECNDVLGSFLRGQLLVMIVLAVYYSFALMLAGLNFYVLIGLMIGLFSLVPLLGTVVSFLLAGLTALFQPGFDAKAVLIVVGIIVVGHILENFVLVPWLIGKKVGLHPVAVIFVIFVGAELFGFTGVLIAVPVAAVLFVLIKEAVRRYQNSLVYIQRG